MHGSLARRSDDQNSCARRRRGPAIDLKLTEGQAHDGRSASDMLDALVEGQILLADRAYDSDALRQRLDARGAWANIKPMPNRKNVPAFSSYLYRYRNLVERFFNKIKQLPRRRHALRQARRQFPRWRQTRLNPYLVAL